ncbi:NYN domain-containing protein [Candidatus Pacearchaeota archaeon]|nr:NYN domain-containing protein [Candidatus Pacearchaeota archaeon]
MPEQERVCVFIDGSNLYNNLKKNKIKIPFEELMTLLEKKRKLINIFYYTAELDKSYNFKKYVEHHEFLEKLKKIPNFRVVLCNLKKVTFEDGSIKYQIKGDDVHLTVDLVGGAYENSYDVAIIVSGDEDFVPAIELVRAKGKKVINAFFPKSSAYRLRSCCDGSINLKKGLDEKKKSQYGEP